MLNIYFSPSGYIKGIMSDLFENENMKNYEINKFLYMWVEWWSPLKICLYKIPRNCTCYLIWEKALRYIIKLRILSKGNHLGLPRWALNPMTNIL